MEKNEKLNLLLSYVKQFNEYYQEKYKNINLPVNSSHDVPILYRKEIRENKFRIISNEYDINNLFHDTTNGTTENLPLDIYKTKHECINSDLNLWKKRWEINKGYSTRYAYYYYNHRVTNSDYYIKINKDKIEIQIPMLKNNINDYLNDIRLLEKNKVTWLIAPPTILYNLACIAQEHMIKFKINIIESVSEYLPSTYKKLVEDTFGAKVIINYSCHEVLGMAFSNEKDELEIMENVIIDEIIDERFKNGYKRCVVTNLIVKSMPFIRYELSDLIIKSGNKLKTYGFRWMEFVEIQGVVIHCSFFVNIFEELEIVKLIPLENFQIIYNDKAIIFILINVNDNYFNNIKQYINYKIHVLYHINPEIILKLDKHFYADKSSGKMRGIVKENQVWYEFGNFSAI